MLTNFPNTYTDARETPDEGQERLIVEMDSDYNSNAGDTPKVKVCLQKWANGIGWYNQKSLFLTLEQAGNLKQEIERTTVNHKMLSSRSRLASAPRRPGKSGDNAPIPFPAGRKARSLTERASQSDPVETGEASRILPFVSRRG